MKRIIIVVALLFLSTSAFAQENQTPKTEPEKTSAVPSQPSDSKQTVVNVDLPPFDSSSLPRRPLPTITLQRALKFAEAYLRKENVKLSLLYLVEAKYDVLGSGADEMHWWIFRWESKERQGNVTELYVSMKGIVWNPPTM